MTNLGLSIQEQNKTCFEENTDIKGYDLPGMPYEDITNPTACQKLCQSNSQCNFWTYGLDATQWFHRNCWLKSSDTGRNSAFPGLTSGRKTCCKLSR